MHTTPRPTARRASALLVSILLATCGAFSPFTGHAAEETRASSGSGDETFHLPRVVNAPGTWSDRDAIVGPVAALGLAMRTRPVGIFATRESFEMFAVSATDGSASWLRLPGFSLQRWGFVGGTAVSPDGRWIGWVRLPERRGRKWQGRVAGWSVMDTTTGMIHELDVPGFDWVRGTMADLAFSGDSRYLLTSYETPDQPRQQKSRVHQFVAWDVTDHTPIVVEEPGHYWLPNLGSAPADVVWSRGKTVFRVDPTTHQVSSLTLLQHVVVASWGPDDTAFAYIGRSATRSRDPWRLYAGKTASDVQAVELPTELQPSQILGWRDASHVVIGDYLTSVQVVDIVTGGIQQIDLRGYGKQLNSPSFASALWSEPLLDPTEPQGTTDPRAPWRWAGATLILLAAAAALILHFRRKPERA